MLFYLLICIIPIASGLKCEEGWVWYGPENVCLHNADNIRLGLDKSVEHCHGVGAKMAKIESEEKMKFLDGIYGTAAHHWLPIDTLTEEGEFRYMDGTPLGDYQKQLFARTKSIPYPDDVCATTFYNKRGEQVSTRTPCFNIMPFFCEKGEFVAECDPGWEATPENDGCFKVIRGRMKNFAGARKYCGDKGGDLATSVTSRRQMSAIMDQINFAANLWIGVHSHESDGTFYYVNGTQVVGKGPFQKGRPGASSKNQCVTLKKKKWFDKDCTRSLFFVCQKAPNNAR